MKKIIFLIIPCLFIVLTLSSQIINKINPIIVSLYEEQNDKKDGTHRSLHCAVIKDNVITFDVFDEDCSMQIVDVDNDLVIHEEFIFSGDTECMFPVLSSGNYKV